MVGETISHYRILAQIGAGGMGVVYKAYDEQLEREVALKVLLPGLLAEEGARKRFRKEALALARLNHPNIATIFEFGNEGGADFLVTEYIPGITLDMKLSAGALGVEETVRLGTQLATGLAAAHEQGLIHRDLKPGNLRVTPDGLLKILDFGLAQLVPRASDDGLTATQTRTQEIAGTLPYMAPEQLRGGMADTRTDIWAAGAVLHEMATGKRPFSESGTPLHAMERRELMIVEQRTYTLYPGKTPEYLRLYESEGMAIQTRILGGAAPLMKLRILPLVCLRITKPNCSRRRHR